MENLIFVDFGAFSVYWYGVCMGVALLTAGLLYAVLRSIQRNSFSNALTTVLIAGPAALAGSRIFYCWFGQASFPGGLTDWLDLPFGGYALYGALLGVLVVLIAQAAVKKQALLPAMDAAVPAAAAAIAIGRFAGGMSGSDIGLELPAGINAALPYVVWSETEQYYTLWMGFFEGIAAGVIFLVTLAVFLRTYLAGHTGLQAGGVALLFAVMYGFSQTMLESMRNDSLFMVTLGFVRISQILSFALAVTGLVIIIVQSCRLQKPRVVDLLLWAICLAALGLSFYCEFRMNASSLVRNYIMMGLSLGILILVSCYWFFRSAGIRMRREEV